MRALLLAVLLLPACAMQAPSRHDRAWVEGRTWVVTGAASGIGRGVAERAGAMGANVVLADIRADALEPLAAQIRASGGQALAVPTDVADPAQVERLAEAATARFGPVAVWLNNAAVASVGPFEATTPEEHARIVAVNLNGVIFGSHAALRRFRAQGHGALVNMGSVESRVPLAYHASYAATKHGILGLNGALREELRLSGQRNIRVITVMPWTVDTTFWENAANRTGRQPTGPWMDSARDVADAIVWAALHRPSGEFPVGPKAEAVALSGQLAPLPSRIAAGAIIHRMQMEAAPPAPNTEGNLFRAVPGTVPRVEGGFSR